MIFTSPYSKLAIVVKPSMHSHDASGKRFFQAGKKAQFVDGRFRTEDKEIIEHLLAHKDLGVMFHAESVKADKQKVESAKKKDESLAKATKAESTNKKAPKVK